MFLYIQIGLIVIYGDSNVAHVRTFGTLQRAIRQSPCSIQVYYCVYNNYCKYVI
jgi:hypothetical protein